MEPLATLLFKLVNIFLLFRYWPFKILNTQHRQDLSPSFLEKLKLYHS